MTKYIYSECSINHIINKFENFSKINDREEQYVKFSFNFHCIFISFSLNIHWIFIEFSTFPKYIQKYVIFFKFPFSNFPFSNFLSQIFLFKISFFKFPLSNFLFIFLFLNFLFQTSFFKFPFSNFLFSNFFFSLNFLFQIFFFIVFSNFFSNFPNITIFWEFFKFGSSSSSSTYSLIGPRSQTRGQKQSTYSIKEWAR